MLSKFQRWFVMLVVLGRLLFAVPVDAMPYGLHVTGESVTSEADEQPCPDHASGASGEQIENFTPASDWNANDVQHDERDCCNGEGCEHLCGHLSAFVTQSQAVDPDLSDPYAEKPSAIPAALHRPRAVFRPPA